MTIPNNSIVEVFGWPMLDRIDSGKYKIEVDEEREIYWFKKPKGRKTIIGHYAFNVDCWIQTMDHPNLNKIVII